MLSGRYKYSRWDGSQDVFQMDADELMDHLSNDVLADGDVFRALRELMRRGIKDQSGQQMPGLRELLDQLKERRKEQLQRYNMDSVMDDIKERLKDVLKTEREGISKRLDEAAAKAGDAEGPERAEMEQLTKLLEQRAQRNLEKLDALPDSAGGAIRELMEYDFMDPEAQRKFQELLDMLQSQMAQNLSQDIMQRLRDMTPDDIAAMQDMLSQLNQMLQDQANGQQPDFEGFMQQYGPMFGPNPPQTLEELMEHMVQQMAQMQSMMDSMSPEARRELEEALNSVLDPETQRQMAQLASLMEQLMPMDDLRRQYPFLGDESLTLEQAMELMSDLQSMDELERAIRQTMRSGNPDDLDPQQLEEQLGEEARQAWEQLQKLLEQLKEAGYITDGARPDLTAKAIRRIGQRALKEVFVNLKKDRMGNHELDSRGGGGDTIVETKMYEFGDPFQLDLNATVKNAITRTGPDLPVKLTPEDFEIYRNEHMTKAATVVLLDQSRSMGLFGSFHAAKKVAMALFALIHSQFPRDNLHVVGFSDYAVEIKEEELAKSNWNSWVSGTNIHHALMLSRKLLSKEKGGSRQILLITDGEPTAYLEGNQSLFSYPPSYKTIMETLKEARKCTQEGIVINTFMLENNYQLMDFVDRMTRINRGRAFYSAPDKLGEFVLVDYVNNRKKMVSR